MRSVLVAGVFGWLALGGMTPVLPGVEIRVAAQEAAPTNPVASSEESIGNGRRVYVVLCQSCHGRDLKGAGRGAPKTGVPPASLVDEKWDHGSSDGEIFNTISKGVPPAMTMQAWGGKIEDGDIWNVINYIRDAAKKAAEAPKAEAPKAEAPK